MLRATKRNIFVHEFDFNTFLLLLQFLLLFNLPTLQVFIINSNLQIPKPLFTWESSPWSGQAIGSDVPYEGPCFLMLLLFFSYIKVLEQSK